MIQLREDFPRSQAPPETVLLATDDAPEETDFVWRKVDSSAEQAPGAETTLRNPHHQISRDWAVCEGDHPVPIRLHRSLVNLASSFEEEFVEKRTQIPSCTTEKTNRNDSYSA